MMKRDIGEAKIEFRGAVRQRTGAVDLMQSDRGTIAQALLSLPNHFAGYIYTLQPAKTADQRFEHAADATTDLQHRALHAVLDALKQFGAILDARFMKNRFAGVVIASDKRHGVGFRALIPIALHVKFFHQNHLPKKYYF